MAANYRWLRKPLNQSSSFVTPNQPYAMYFTDEWVGVNFTTPKPTEQNKTFSWRVRVFTESGSRIVDALWEYRDNTHSETLFGYDMMGIPIGTDFSFAIGSNLNLNQVYLASEAPLPDSFAGTTLAEFEERTDGVLTAGGFGTSAGKIGTYGGFDFRNLTIRNINVDRPVINLEKEITGVTITGDIYAIPESTPLFPDGWAPSSLTLGAEAASLSKADQYWVGSSTISPSASSSGYLGSFNRSWDNLDVSSGEPCSGAVYIGGFATSIAELAYTLPKGVIISCVRCTDGTCSGNGIRYVALDAGTVPNSLGYGWHQSTHSVITETAGRVHLNSGGSYISWVEDNGSYVPFLSTNRNELVKDMGSATARYVITSPDQTIQEFDEDGKLRQVIDRNGNTMTYIYNGITGKLETVADENGNSLHYTYRASDGQPLTMRENDPTTGRLTQYQYYPDTDPDIPDRLYKVIDPEGNETTYLYYLDGPLWIILDEQGLIQSEFFYDAYGRVVAEVKYQKVAIERNYYTTSNRVDISTVDLDSIEPTRKRRVWNNRFGNPVLMQEVLDGEVIESTISYEDSNNVYLPTKSVDPNLNVTLTTYTDDGLVKTTTDKNGNVTTLTYAEEIDTPLNPKHRNLIRKIARPEVTLSSGKKVTYQPTEFEYDADGNLTKVIDAKGQETVMSYTSDGLVSSVTDRRGNTTTFHYEGLPFNNDSRNLLEIRTPKGVTPADGYRSVYFEYDDYNNVTSVEDELGNEVVTEYDLLDRVKKITDANGHVTEYFYDGLLLSEVRQPPNQASGAAYRRTNFYYNSQRKVWWINRDNDGQGNQDVQVEYSYNGFGEMTDLIRNRDGLYKKFQFEYDLLGRPVKITDSSGEVSESGYEPFCVGQSTTSARGIRRKSSFDSRCLLAEVEVGDPHADPDDLLSVEDPRVRYNFEYDELGRLTRKAERSSVYGSARIGTGFHQTVEEFEYDELDRLVRISRSERSEFGEARFGGIYLNGPNTFRFEYDPEGNLSKKVDPEGNVTEYTYYRDGLLKDVIVKRLSQSDRIFTYEYDDAGRLDKLSYPTSTDVEVLFRDEADLTPTGIGTGFDGNGNLRFMRYQNTNGTLLRRFEYTYDDSNNRISLLDVDPSKAVKWEYGYDWLDRLVSVKRAEAVDVSSLPATTLQRTYVFDESDNRKFFDDHVNGVTYHYKYKSVNKQIPVYTQEELRQLILPWIDQNLSQFIDDIEDILQDTIEDYTGQTTQELEDFASSDLNGFVEMLEYAANQRVEEIYEDDFQQFNQVTFHSDLLDEILVYDTAAGHRTVGDFVLFESFEHDADGNMTKRTLAGTGDETDHTWSDFDRLVKVEKTSGAQTDTLQEALYDSDGLRFRKTDKNGNSSVEHGIGITTSASIPGPGTSAAPTISYIQGHLILGAEINDGANSEFVYHLPDALGSTRDVIDESGNIVRTFEFDEYGNLLSSSGSGAATPKTWIGGLSVNDDTADSGMFNMGHRNYAGGVLGRFISRDPIGHSGGLNLYEYSYSNPINVIDQSGLGELGTLLKGVTTNHDTQPMTWNELAGITLSTGELIISAGVIVVITIDGLPVAGYYAARAGFTRLGGCLTSAGLEAGSAIFGSTMLYHGSKNAPSVRQSGLRTSPGSRGAFVSPQRAAAENANSRTARGGELIQRGVRRNGVWTNDYVIPDSELGVVKFKIPKNQMRRFPTTDGEYEGWGGKGLGWQQIEISDKKSLWILNQGMCEE